MKDVVSLGPQLSVPDLASSDSCRDADGSAWPSDAWGIDPLSWSP
jgi:hypothetical protein